VREKVLNQDVIIKFISTDDQVADVFTKGLGSSLFIYLRLKLMVIPSPISLWGAVRDNIAVAQNHTQDTLAAPHQNTQAAPNQISQNTINLDRRYTRKHFPYSFMSDAQAESRHNAQAQFNLDRKYIRQHNLAYGATNSPCMESQVSKGKQITQGSIPLINKENKFHTLNGTKSICN
jgi:hypothetical protein